MNYQRMYDACDSVSLLLKQNSLVLQVLLRHRDLFINVMYVSLHFQLCISGSEPQVCIGHIVIHDTCLYRCFAL